MRHYIKSVIFSSVFILILTSFNLSGEPLINPKAPRDFADIVAPLLPSVVNISTTTELKRDRRFDMMPQQGITMEDLLRQFLDENSAAPMAPRARKAVSLGSGFIIAQEGDVAYIVTCNHVITDVDEINITLNDDVTSYKGEVIGRDQRTDLALLKMKTPKKLTPAQWGNSNKLRVGEYLIAIGNPFGLSSTVTTGIVSTISRDIGRDPTIYAADYVQGYIQTDASINMGNSGGPMFNIDGQVIGVSRVIFSPNGGSIGLGFGVPSNQAQAVIEQLKKFGRTQRGWIGIVIRPFTAEDAESLGLKDNSGAFINDVTASGPAAKAGLQGGDLVLSYDQEKVKDSRHLQYLVGDAAINSKHKLTVWRAGKQIILTVVIAEFEKAEEMGLTGTKPPERAHPDEIKGDRILGMVLKDITPELADRHGLDVRAGLIVEFVEPGSEAEAKGIVRGLIILNAISGSTKVDLKQQNDLKKIVAKVKKEGKKNIMLQVKDSDTKIYISVPLS